MLGASISFTVTVKEQLAELLLRSVARQTLIDAPTGWNAPLAKPLIWTFDKMPQLSAAVGGLYVTTAPQSPGSLFFIRLAGQVMVGNCVSFTVTENEQVRVLLLPSTARQVTELVPTGKKEPLAPPLNKVLERMLQLSEATGVEYVTLAPHWFRVLDVEILAGQVILGKVTSITRATNTQVAVLPAPSVAVSVMLLFPSGKAEFRTGVWVTAFAGKLQLSLTLASPVKFGTIPWQEALALMVCCAGQVILGGVRSFTVT